MILANFKYFLAEIFVDLTTGTLATFSGSSTQGKVFKYFRQVSRLIIKVIIYS